MEEPKSVRLTRDQVQTLKAAWFDSETLQALNESLIHVSSHLHQLKALLQEDRELAIDHFLSLAWDLGAMHVNLCESFCASASVVLQYMEEGKDDEDPFS